MAIIIDDQASKIISQGRERHDTAIIVYPKVVAVRGAHATLCVGWARSGRPANLLTQQVGDITLYIDERIARYAQWHDITITGWRLGPIRQLLIVDEPLVELRLRQWERTHRGVGYGLAA